jgi:hypothetical protein
MSIESSVSVNMLGNLVGLVVVGDELFRTKRIIQTLSQTNRAMLDSTDLWWSDL